MNTNSINNKGPFLNESFVELKKKDEMPVGVKTDKNSDGLVGGIGYTAGKLGTGLAGVFEGIGKGVEGIGSLIAGDKEYAKYVFSNSEVDKWRKQLDDWYNPGSIMSFVGDAAEGVGQSSVFLLNAIPGLGQAGTAAFFVGAAGNGISDAVRTTGDIGAKEITYGLLSSAAESAMEAVSGAGGKAAKAIAGKVTVGVGKRAVSNLAATAAKQATWKMIGKEMVTSAAGEFVEEFLGDFVDVGLRRMTGVDPNASTSVGQALYSGLVGAASGAIMGGVSSAVVQRGNQTRGRRIIEAGNADATVGVAQAFSEQYAQSKDKLIRGVNEELKTSIDAWNKVTDKSTPAAARIMGEIQSTLGNLNLIEAVQDVSAKIKRIVSEDPSKGEAMIQYLNIVTGIKDASNGFKAEDLLRDGSDALNLMSVLGFAGEAMTNSEGQIVENVVSRIINDEDVSSDKLNITTDKQTGLKTERVIRVKADVNTTLDTSATDHVYVFGDGNKIATHKNADGTYNIGIGARAESVTTYRNYSAERANALIHAFAKFETKEYATVSVTRKRQNYLRRNLDNVIYKNGSREYLQTLKNADGTYDIKYGETAAKVDVFPNISEERTEQFIRDFGARSIEERKKDKTAQTSGMRTAAEQTAQVSQVTNPGKIGTEDLKVKGNASENVAVKQETIQAENIPANVPKTGNTQTAARGEVAEKTEAKKDGKGETGKSSDAGKSASEEKSSVEQIREKMTEEEKVRAGKNSARMKQLRERMVRTKQEIAQLEDPKAKRTMSETARENRLVKLRKQLETDQARYNTLTRENERIGKRAETGKAQAEPTSKTEQAKAEKRADFEEEYSSREEAKADPGNNADERLTKISDAAWRDGQTYLKTFDRLSWDRKRAVCATIQSAKDAGVTSKLVISASAKLASIRSGLEIRFSDKVASSSWTKIDPEHGERLVLVSTKSADQIVIRTELVHEMIHDLRYTNSAAYAKIKKAAFDLTTDERAAEIYDQYTEHFNEKNLSDYLKENNLERTEENIDKYFEKYDGISRENVEEEITAKYVMNDARVNRLFDRLGDRSTWRKFLDVVSDFREAISERFSGKGEDEQLLVRQSGSIEKTILQALGADYAAERVMRSYGYDGKEAYGERPEANEKTDGTVKYEIKYPKYSKETIEKNQESLAQMESVRRIDESKLERSGKRPSEMFEEYFERLGNNIHSEEFGDIGLTHSSVKSEIRHGITAEKLASIEAIPDVIQHGVVIDTITKNAGGNLERIVIGAPIEIGKDRYYMGVMLQRDTKTQRLYIHDVITEKETSTRIEKHLNTTGSVDTNQNLFITSILQKAIDVKNPGEFSQKKNLPDAKATDRAYLDAVKRGDTETAERMVREAAKRAGYDTVLYHGTQNFGFTQIDVKKYSDDGMSFFATSSPDMAQTYSGKNGVKLINDSMLDVKNMTDVEVIAKLNEEATNDGYGDHNTYRFMSAADIKKFFADIDQRIENFEDVITRKTSEYANKLVNDFSQSNITAHDTLVKLLEATQNYKYGDISTPLWALLTYTDVFGTSEKKLYSELEADIRLRNKLEAEKTSDGAVVKEDSDRYSIRVMPMGKAREELAQLLKAGNYSLYGKTKGFLEVDGNGRNWNEIYAILEPQGGNTLNAEYDFESEAVKLRDKNGEFAEIPAKSLSDALSPMSREITKRYGKYLAEPTFTQVKDQLKNNSTAEVQVRTTGRVSTRDIAKFAKEQGYQGVKVTGIYDNGGRGAESGNGDVYIFFNPEQNVKSADAVTYDDSGNVIPLSERFNEKKTDIRYNLSETSGTDKDAKIAKLTEELNEARKGEEQAKKEAENANKRAKHSEKEAKHEMQAAYDCVKVVDEIKKMSEAMRGNTQIVRDEVSTQVIKLAEKIGRNAKNPFKESSSEVFDLFAAVKRFMVDEDAANPGMMAEQNGDWSFADRFSPRAKAIIEELAAQTGSKKILSEEDLWNVRSGLLALKKAIRDADKVVINERKESLSRTAAEGVSAVREAAEIRGKNADAPMPLQFLKKMADGVRKTYLYQTITPRAVIESLECYSEKGVLSKIYRDVEKATTAAADDFLRYTKTVSNFLDQNKGYAEHMRKDSVTVMNEELSVGRAIALYMTTKRDQAVLHIEGQGIKIENVKGEVVRLAEDQLIPYQERYDNKVLTKQIQTEIEKQLTAEDKAYIGVLEKFFNDTATKEKCDADDRIQGFHDLMEAYYFPISADKVAMVGSVTDARKGFMDIDAGVTGLSMNKEVNARAKNAIYISDVTDVFENHARQLSMYKNLYLPLQAFDRVYNQRVVLGDGSRTSVRELLNDTVWRTGSDGKASVGADKYFKKLFSDLQGIRGEGSALDRALSYFRGNYAAAVLGANPKVVLSQAASYPMAFTMLDLDILSKALVMKPDSKGLLDASALARVRFGSNEAYDSMTAGAGPAMRGIRLVSEALSKGIGWMDKVTIERIWTAAQLQAEKNGKGAVGTKENVEAAVELFEDVTRTTQPTYDTATRSGLQRSNSELAKTFAMFTSVGMKQLSEIVTAADKFFVTKKKGKMGLATDAEVQAAGKSFAKKTSAVAAATAAFVLMNVLVKHLTGTDDEDKNVGEELADESVSALVSMLPIASDIYSYLSSGYSINSFGADTIQTFADSVKDASTLIGGIFSGEAQDDTKLRGAARRIIVTAGKAVGLPVGNAQKYAIGILSKVNAQAGYRAKSYFYSKDYVSDMKKAIANGDEDLAANIYSLMEKRSRTGSEATDRTANEVTWLYAAGHKNVLARQIGTTVKVGGETVTLTKKQKSAITKIYGEAEDVIEEMIGSAQYPELDDNARAAAIKSVYDSYYAYALSEVMGEEYSKDNALKMLWTGKNDYLYHVALSYVKNLKSETDATGKTVAGSRRKAAETYLKKIGLSEEERTIVLWGAGYRSDADAEKLSEIISAKGLSDEQKKVLKTAL